MVDVSARSYSDTEFYADKIRHLYKSKLLKDLDNNDLESALMTFAKIGYYYFKALSEHCIYNMLLEAYSEPELAMYRFMKGEHQ